MPEQSQAAAVDRRSISHILQEVRVRHDLVMEDDDQGPFLNCADADDMAIAIRNRMWGQHLGYSALHGAATRVSLKLAPILAAFRDTHSSIGPDQYEDALEAMAALKHCLNVNEPPELR